MGGRVNIIAGNANGGDAAGGPISITSGNAAGNANGGGINVHAGSADPVGSGNGGNINLSPGVGAGGGTDGMVVIQHGGINMGSYPISNLGTTNVTMDGSGIYFLTGDGSNTTYSVSAGDGNPAGSGGQLNGGDIILAAGAGVTSGTGGNAILQAGIAQGATGNGGIVQLTSGSASTSGNGGNVVIQTGSGAGGGADGDVLVAATHLLLQDTRLKSIQGLPPTIAATANAGTGASASLSNATDTAGKISLTTTATSSLAGAQATISFHYVKSVAPVVILTPANAAAANIGGQQHEVYITSTVNDFSINFGSRDNAGGTYQWHYLIIETQ